MAGVFAIEENGFPVFAISTISTNRLKRMKATPTPDNARQMTHWAMEKHVCSRSCLLSVPVYTAANFFCSIFLLRLFVRERGRGIRKFYPSKDKESFVFDFEGKGSFGP